MHEVEMAIEKITYENKKFPQEALEVIIQNKEKAIPYLRKAIAKAIEEKNELEDCYQLHFYALFLLGQFQDKESFGLIIELITLPREVLDYLIGDTITSGLKDILYNTYDGEIESLKKIIVDEYVDEFVRAAVLGVMTQLYLDGAVETIEFKDFIKQNIYDGREYNYIFNAFASVICKCHFVEMLPEIKFMLNNGLMDEMCLGKYDSCVDEMFTYRDFDQQFCKTPMCTISRLKTWAMFEKDNDTIDSEEQRKNFEKLMKSVMKNSRTVEVERRVGRNDPCPCGSGKKYKFCCLNKPKSAIDLIESAQERNKCLQRYPYIGMERLDDKVYIEDYFDTECIEIDRLLYLGLASRPGLIWLKDEKQENKRCREYLSLAFPLFIEKVRKENIKNFKEYDSKYSIHYFCDEWISKLLELLIESGDTNLYQDVKKCRKEML